MDQFLVTTQALSAKGLILLSTFATHKQHAPPNLLVPDLADLLTPNFLCPLLPAHQFNKQNPPPPLSLYGNFDSG